MINRETSRVVRVNVFFLIVFVFLFVAGTSETGYSNMGSNLIGVMLMFLSAIGLISQMVVFLIYVYKEESSSE